MLSPTGLKCSTSNCRSKPIGNKRNDRISRTPSRKMKNKVEAQPRKVNKNNRVVEPIRDVDIKHSLLNANSEPICATCNKSMFDSVHDMCLLDFVENVNNRAKSAKKHKKQNIWKPTGHSTQASSFNPSKKIKLTIISTRQLFVNISSDEDDTTTTSLITKSSSPSPPNAPSKTSSTKDTSSTFGNTSSLFESKPQSLPPSSNDTPSTQPSNLFLNDIMDVPPRPSNPIPLQSHTSLDITLSLSPITPLDHILDTLSPQPPPLMCHPIYFNYHDYHGLTCLCCFHNRNLFFTLSDEMNLMFAHLECLLTSAIVSPSPPHP
ncbi:hypothetical protein Tco_1012900 [Tanacetum coccineum]